MKAEKCSDNGVKRGNGTFISSFLSFRSENPAKRSVQSRDLLSIIYIVRRG